MNDYEEARRRYRFLRNCVLASYLGLTVHAQELPPKVLVQSAQCLVAKDFLPATKATALRFGYILDTKSYPGEKVIYVVDYTGSGRSDGVVFAILMTQKDGRQIYDIQNNARFVRSKDGEEGIDFVEPPLGGTWTQQHLVTAIKSIERLRTITVRASDLLRPTTGTVCVSYTDGK
jgi:hypothetical protein